MPDPITPPAVPPVDPAPPADPPADPPVEKDPPGAEELGDKGKKALDAMKAERNAAREEARKAAEELARLKAEAEGKQAEFAAQQKAREVEAAALAKANERILKAEVRAAAAAKLADPADALRFIDLSSLEVGDDGEVDSDAIAAAIDDLIKNKPYLAVQDGKRFQGGADGGARKESQPKQLSKADVDRMYANKQYDEIEKARQEGRLANVLGATN